MNKLFIILISLFFACSSSKKNTFTEDINSNGVNIEVKSIYIWLDKMPSSLSNNNLRLAADLIIKNSDDYNNNELKLTKVVIKQDSSIIYSFKPIVKENLQYNKKNSRNIIVSTIEKTELPEEFNVNKEVNAIFIFEIKNKKFFNIYKNIKVEVTF
ncbi:MAG TPA: hypothetical protein PL041_09240 [Melioribacteraceae bacterium]|nr:hypothetical protein [Melioribacteraceae bacterium]